jgi:nucleotide-binding universal stress UspA family protein
MKILLAVDGSRYSKKAVAFLLANREKLLASERGDEASLHVINVQAIVPPRVRSVLGSEMVKKYHEEEARKVLRPIGKTLDAHNITHTADWVVGVAADEILRAAKRNKAHMIVMGTHGYGVMGRIIMGSVAQRVLEASPVPVLLIK